ncbi:hypothetical protein ACJRO7_002057 [Eucalyptus globulus]|uniref:Uncharacterized protein n=1 Tax=Eucalyptus globulus TaxID=34317 RepID=A0ABD3LT14_EUCGL
MSPSAGTCPFPSPLGWARPGPAHPGRCFLDTGYAIVRGRSAAVLVLRSLRLQVLNVSIPAHYSVNPTAAMETTSGLHDGAVKAHLPVVRHQWDGARPSSPNVSLRSSPSTSSLAVGSNNLAVTAEAASRCDGGGLGNFSDCSGVGYCRTSIPSGLRALGVKFKRISVADAVAVGEKCRLAFLADKEWLAFNGSKDLRVPREMEFVHGVLEWGIRKRW